MNCGRRMKASLRQLRMVEIAVRRSPSKSSTRLQQEMLKSGLHVGASTLRRYLMKMGLVSRIAPRKPLLTRWHQAMRLAFARKYVKGSNFWHRVLFNDETRISIRNDCQKMRVRRKTGERMKIINPTVKHPPSVMLWGSFAAGGPSRIRFLDKGETCNTACYIKVLNQQMRWSAQSLFAECEFYLQDDGAPCHRSNAVKGVINAQGWKTLDWPPQSPDLNPIENLWALLKKKIWNTNFNSTVELKARIISVWHHSIDGDLLNKLAMSMPDRLLRFLKHNIFILSQSLADACLRVARLRGGLVNNIL